jgi:hypothetical protein
MMGKVISGYRLNDKVNTLDADFTQVSAGIYFCSLLHGNARIATRKIVIAR